MGNDVVHPRIIQGGMGIGVSGWRLARTVASTGNLGVVSGTCLDTLLVRVLQDGDKEGLARGAAAKFPNQELAQKIIEDYYVEGGIPENKPYKALPLAQGTRQSQERDSVGVLASFVEVTLAKGNHGGPVGINLLTKIQLPTLSTLYGAILAGVDYVLMGAGIPREIPRVIDSLVKHEPAAITLDIDGKTPEKVMCEFVPAEHGFGGKPEVKRPFFFPIISSHTLGQMLLKKAGRIDGFIVENSTAGGHNAPPRSGEISPAGEPIYGPRDEADLTILATLGLPFWLAGSFGTAGGLKKAMELGAHGIQVGTLFAFSNESGLSAALKKEVLTQANSTGVSIWTDGVASPTGYPFKVVQIGKTLSNNENYQKRERVCDLGYLRAPYPKEDGSIGWRCSAEPIDQFIKKGGTEEGTVGKKCLCNALFANLELGQKRRGGYEEQPLLTSGDQLAAISEFLQGREEYSAMDVLEYVSK